MTIKVTFLDVPDIGYQIRKIVGRGTSAGIFPSIIEHVEAHPKTVGFDSITDMRRFEGYIADDDFQAFMRQYVRLRKEAGVPVSSIRNQVFIHSTELAAGAYTEYVKRAMRITAPIVHVVTVAQAWDAIAPGASIPREVRAFLS